MAEHVFTSEVYPLNSYLNPSRQKLKTLFLKKSLQTGRQAHNRARSMNCAKHANSCCCASEGGCVRELREMLAGNSDMLK
jgi:hypothetical protein